MDFHVADLLRGALRCGRGGVHINLLLIPVVGSVSVGVPGLALGGLFLALSASINHVHVALSLVLSLLSGVG